jgi:hypothetical protein
MDVDIVEVVEILAVKPSKDEHATAEEASTVASSGLGSLSGHFHRGNNVFLWVHHEDIAEIIAKSAPIYVDFILVYC